MVLKSETVEIHKINWVKLVVEKGKWYFISSIFTKGVGIFLIPIYTKYFSPTDYGILSSLNVIAQLLPIFISLYLDSAFGRFFHDAKNDKNKLVELFSTIYYFVIGFGTIILILVLSTAHVWLTSLLSIPVFPYMLLAFVPTLFNQMGLLGIVFLRQSLESKQTTLIQVSSVILSLSTTLPLLINFHMGIVAKLCGDFASGLFLAIFYTIYFYKNGFLKIVFDVKVLRKCLSYSIPLIPNIAGGWIAGLSDRLVIAKFVDLKSVGIYSLAYQLATSLYVIQDAITQVTSPLTISGLLYEKEKTKEKIASNITFLLSIMLFANLSLIFFSKELVYVFADKRYYEAYKIVGIIGLIYVLSCFYRVFTDIISFHKKTWIISVAGILMGIVNLGLNLIFVPRWGYNASVFATVISMGAYTLWIFFWSQKLEKIDLQKIKLVLISGLYLAMVILSNFLITGPISIERVGIKLLLMCFVLLMYLYINKRKKYILQVDVIN